MRDLLQAPCCAPEDLGHPLPDSDHAVSVALPLWQHVIGYEENDPAVTSKFRCGYPRFFLPPLLQQLATEAESRLAQPGEGCLIYPSLAAAERCLQFVRTRIHSQARVIPYGRLGLAVVAFPEAHRSTVREYWRYAGETVSTRMAEAALRGREDAPAKGAEAKALIRQRLARMADVQPQDVFLFPSGMAAVFAVHRMLQHLLPGRRSVQLDFPYVDVLKVQQEFGEGVSFFPTAGPEVLAEVRRLAEMGELCGVFCEMPSNPLLRAVRLSDFAPSMRQHGVPLVVDDTVATVANIDALRFADVVTSSLTKTFSGAGDVLAGAVTLNPRSPFYAAFSLYLSSELLENDIFWWEDAVALEKNSRDFPKRVRRSSHNAAALAAMLRSHPKVASVWYPGGRHDGLEEILRPGAGYGCLLSFILRNPADAPVVYDSLRVSKGPSLGTNFTLVCPYTLLAHYQELDWAESCGVPSHLLRVSAGLEETSDLLERFRAALAAIAD